MVLSPDSLSGWRLFEEGRERYCGHDFIGFLAVKELGPEKFEIVSPSISILAEPPLLDDPLGSCSRIGRCLTRRAVLRKLARNPTVRGAHGHEFQKMVQTQLGQ